MRLLRVEIHFFLIAAYKLVEHIECALSLNYLDDRILKMIDPVKGDIKALRDKNEHVIEYFRGGGRRRGDWITERDDGVADASSLIGTRIGNRLDYVVVCDLAKVISESLPSLRRQLGANP